MNMCKDMCVQVLGEVKRGFLGPWELELLAILS